LSQHKRSLIISNANANAYSIKEIKEGNIDITLESFRGQSTPPCNNTINLNGMNCPLNLGVNPPG